MSDSAKRPEPPGRSTEDQVEKIQEIHGSEVLGHQGAARGEHSGENSGKEETAMDDLADNAPGQLGR